MTRAVLITGAAGGIGRASAEHFVALGWSAFAVDSKEPSAALPPGCSYIHADVSRPDAFAGVVREIRKSVDTLEALVNNAAIQLIKPLLDTSAEEWDGLMATNLRAAFLAAKAAYPLLRAAGGAAIVNVSSVHALQTSINIAAYAASKGGLVALTRAMAIEFAADRIRVNAVLPGAVDTPMLRAGLNRSGNQQADVTASLADLARRTVSSRIGEPAEIAQSIYFLADGTQSAFITGQTLVVDGGAASRLSTE